MTNNTVNSNQYQANIEKAVLATILFDSEVLETIEPILKADMFYLRAYAEIYRVMIELYKKDHPVDEDFVLKNVDKSIANESSIIEVLSANGASNVEHYAKEIIENYRRRTLVSYANELKIQHQDGKDSIIMLEDLAKKIDNLDHDTGGKSLNTVHDMEVYYENLPPLKKIPTGLMVADAATALDGGIEQGQFVFISGKKETGKTYFATTIMENMAADGVKCGFFSLEFGARQYIKKLHEKYPHKDNKRRVAISQNVYIDHETTDINDLERQIKKMVKKGVEFIFIDSQLRVSNAGFKNATKAELLANVFSRIGLLCQKHDLIIAMVVQTSKSDHDAEEVSVKGCIDADHECGVWFHFLKHKDSETRTILLAKNKQNFKRRKVDVRFDPDTHSFKIIHEHDTDNPNINKGGNSIQPVVTQYEDDPDWENEQTMIDVDMPYDYQ